MRAFLLLATVLASSACYLVRGEGSDDDSTPGDGEGEGEGDQEEEPVLDPELVAQAVADAEDYCDRLATAACTALEACCAEGWPDHRRDQCFRFFSEGCRGDLVPSAEQLYLAVAPGGAEACETAIRQAYESCPLGASSPDLLPECTSALVSTALAGGCCECEYGLGCGRVDDETCEEGATCGVLPTEGERCLGPGLCARGLWCADDFVCRPRPREGEPCVRSTAPPCEGGLFCHPDTEVCERRAGTGEPCVGPIECIESASCDFEQGICVADARSPYCALPDGWQSAGAY